MKKTLLAFLCCFSVQLVFAQIRLDSIPSGTGVSELLENHFLADNMILVGDNFYGNWSNIRIFSNGQSTIGLDSGIFLSTGDSDEALQHPDSLMNSDLPEGAINSIIQLINGLHEGEDSQIFELYFVPVGDSVSFDFVLASEHYEALECMEDYDRLEVQLISVDVDPQVRNLNLSHVPGKPNIPVNSNTVNRGFGIDGEIGCVSQDSDWEANSQYYHGSHPDLAFNGFTKVISTTPVEVIPYQQYRLIISLSEGDGPSYDSGLFLGKGSFTSFIDWPVQYEIIRTFFEFCDTLRVGNLEITEEGAYFARITEPYSPIDTFYQLQAYKIREEVTIDYGICPGDTLIISGNIVTAPANIEEFGTSYEGCDSITHHIVKWSRSSVDSIYYQHRLCIGDTLFILDTFLIETTVYQVNTNGGLCDTAYFYIAEFGEMVERVETIFACPGDTLELLGKTVTETTLLADTLISETACDTLLVHKVVFQELEFSVEDLTFCFGDTIEMRYGEQFEVIDLARVDSANIDPHLVLRDGPGVEIESPISIKGFGATTQVMDLEGVAEICLTLEHSWLYDLEIFVTAPNGSQVVLQNQRFITRVHYLGEPIDGEPPGLEIPGVGYQYCWTMEASRTMTELSDMEPHRRTIPAGNYLPHGGFQAFSASLVDGIWKLTIQDLWGEDNGFLFDWHIRFSNTPTDSITRQGWFTSNDNLLQDSVSLVGALPVGDYPFDYFVETAGECYLDTTLNLQIRDRPDLPVRIDTFLCEPGFVFDQWIDSSGSYKLNFGPPIYCESATTELIVRVRDSISAQLSLVGSQDTYTFTVTDLEGEQVLIDFGDGQSSTEQMPTYTYVEAGSYQPSATISNGCDTITLLFPIVTVPDRYSATGYIVTGPWSGNIEGISEVEVLAKSAENTYPDKSTNENGEYIFYDLWINSSFNLQPSKNDDPLNGLDIADLIRLSRHLNGSYLFTYPEQTLAADLDCDAMITNQDILELRSFLLEPGKEFPDSCASWMFWPQNYPLEDVSSPFDHPVDISIDSIQADTAGLNFYGVKRGDIGGNATAARGGAPPDSLFLRLKNGYVPKGEQVRLDFRVENFDKLVGFQAELRYDTTALDFEGLMLGEVPGLAEEHFGLSKVQEGIIRVVWLDILGNNYSLADGTLAFGLHFVAKQEIIDRSEHIAIDFREFNAASFNAELVEGPVALKIDFLTGLRESDQQPFRLLQNQPNPFSKTTIIPFYLPKACQARLTILNLAGQVVLQEEGQYGAGDHREEIHLDAPGIYYYVLTTPWGRLSKRMVLTR